MAELTLGDSRAPALQGGAPPSAPVAHIQRADDGTASLHLLVEGVHCANCIARIERALTAMEGIVSARVNFSTRRLAVAWQGPDAYAADIVETLEKLGYSATPFDPSVLTAQVGAEDAMLLRALGVAGFAAANVMLLSVSVWAGLWSDMEAVTRDLLHWVSALIALPAVAYAGQPFFRSALRALRAGHANMDVPISLAVILAAGVSLVETIGGGVHAYFDASVTLLFFLLIGRYLDRRARGEAQSAAERLLLLQATAAIVIGEEGSRRSVPVAALAAGMRLAVAPGDRFPADGEILRGETEIDAALVTGESLPQEAGPGDKVYAGTLNLSGAVELGVDAVGETTLLGQIARLVELAEQGRARYVRLADRVARFYAPVVHLLAAATFLGWYFWGAIGWQPALLNAVAVLIITCPCALGLAVPAVQVVASGRLFARGMLGKSADGLERLAEADMVVFDKTGTLTLGRPELIGSGPVPEDLMAAAARLAMTSKHPLSRALVAGIGTGDPAENVTELPGRGLTGLVDGKAYRLGSREWCSVPDEVGTETHSGPELWLAGDDIAPIRFRFRDTLRSDAGAVVAELRRRRVPVALLSGDRSDVVRDVARALNIGNWQADCRPADKAAWLASQAAQGRKVLMVGDGLNDAPALAAAHVSVSPATGADISQVNADFILQGANLSPLLDALSVAQGARTLSLQNLGLAVAYNAVAVPFAMAGFVTPLVAALAMSSSSLIVITNALRLKFMGRRESA